MSCICVDRLGLRCAREVASVEDYPEHIASARGENYDYCAVCLHGVCDSDPNLGHRILVA
jgi:hypothetical protein